MTALLISICVIAAIYLVAYLEAKYCSWTQDGSGDVYDRKGNYICNWPVY